MRRTTLASQKQADSGFFYAVRVLRHKHTQNTRLSAQGMLKSHKKDMGCLHACMGVCVGGCASNGFAAVDQQAVVWSLP